jgi:hypothetical protein
MNNQLKKRRKIKKRVFELKPNEINTERVKELEIAYLAKIIPSSKKAINQNNEYSHHIERGAFT